MKNQINSLATTVARSAKRTLGSMFFLLLMGNSIAQSENNRVDVDFSRSLSGNGFGSFYHAGISLNKGKSNFGIAANIQQRNMKFCGAQLSYNYSLLEGNNRPGERIGLFLFSDVKFISNAGLSKKSAAFEQRIARENRVDFSGLKLSTLETYVGFGAKCTVSKSVKIFGALGIGGWFTTAGGKELYRDYNGQSLLLKAGISYSLN